MKNTIFCISLFFILIAFLLFADYRLRQLCTEIITTCNILETEIVTKDSKSNYNKSMNLFNSIKHNNLIASIYLNHVDYDLLLSEAVKLSVYIQMNDKKEAEASLHILKFNAENLMQLQFPNLKNVF